MPDISVSNLLNNHFYVISPASLPNHGFIFVNHSASGRGGHLGHALFQTLNGDLIAFFSNCNKDNNGHSGRGWMSYRRSFDFGRTWSASEDFSWSKDVYDSNNGTSVMCEKAVTCNNGVIVLFSLVCDVSHNALWEPYLYPCFQRSEDHGYHWSSPVFLGLNRGRIYDALYRNGVIYVLIFANSAEESWTGCSKEHVYQLYTSIDNGKSFSLRSVLPIDTHGRGYGTMEFLSGERLLVGVYNINDEEHMDVIISSDLGNTWNQQQSTFLSKRIRNPQLIHFGSGYFLHGRSGNSGTSPGNFVLYYSADGLHWDDGCYLCLRDAGFGEYSNSLIVHDKILGKDRLLIQSSHAYRDNLTNIHHWWVDTVDE